MRRSIYPLPVGLLVGVRTICSIAQGSKGSAQDVEAKIREMAQAMERASLTVREEKATLAEMKRMRDLNKKMIQWEASMDEKRSERATLGDALQELYHEMNRCKRQVWLEEVSAEMKIPLEELHDVEVPVGEGMLELLSTSLWKKRLQVALSAFSNPASCPCHLLLLLAGTLSSCRVSSMSSQELHGVAP